MNSLQLEEVSKWLTDFCHSTKWSTWLPVYFSKALSVDGKE